MPHKHEPVVVVSPEAKPNIFENLGVYFLVLLLGASFLIANMVGQRGGDAARHGTTSPSPASPR